ncbi:MAG TPA: hypothetical protein VIZ18_14030 [Ktedonobacteraceae bacterium]
MIQTSDFGQTQTQAIEPGLYAARPIIFYPERQAVRRNHLLATFLIMLTFWAAVMLAFAAYRFWPTYTHPFTPYLKWQDALLATLCYGSIILLIAAITLVRFHFACRQGSRQGILILQPDGTLTVRDLSPKNFHAVYSMVGSSFSCFLVTLVGLSPLILIGWTLHLSHLIFIVATTAVAIAISLAGLILSLIFATFLIIGLIGARALARALGVPHTYSLTSLTTLRIDNDTLTITCPNQPETLFDLHLLQPHDQRYLLHLLQQHIRHGSVTSQPTSLDQHLEAALQHSLNRPPLSV